MQNSDCTGADPFIAADVITEALGQLAAFTFMHLDAEDAPAPDIDPHIEVEVLTFDGAWQQGDGSVDYIVDGRCSQHGRHPGFPRRGAPVEIIQEASCRMMR